MLVRYGNYWCKVRECEVGTISQVRYGRLILIFQLLLSRILLWECGPLSAEAQKLSVIVSVNRSIILSTQYYHSLFRWIDQSVTQSDSSQLVTEPISQCADVFRFFVFFLRWTDIRKDLIKNGEELKKVETDLEKCNYCN